MDESLLTIDGAQPPVLLCAPMAGITHSAFRRLLADFGGYRALYTEMLSGAAICSENIEASPYTKKRACEGAVVYQLLLNGSEDIGKIIECLAPARPAGIDLNLGCPAPEIRKIGAGAVLFDDMKRLERVLEQLRRHWPGQLFVKCRLGREADTWQQAFCERLRLFEAVGVDALAVHPRFFHEKLKRSARWKLLPWIAGNTSLALIANGDIAGRNDLGSHPDYFASVKAIMIGRMAVVKPWIFREWAGEEVRADYAEVWKRLFAYVCEDFPPEKRLGRMKEFTAYYSRNFFFGHTLFSASQRATDIDSLHDAALRFLSANPRTVAVPLVSGV